MPKAILVATSEPATPEQEAAYHAWYDDIHLPDITALPGFVSATRYKVSKTQMRGAVPDVPAYVAIYHIEADDLEATLKGIGDGVKSGNVRMEGSESMRPGGGLVLYEELPPGTGG